MISLSTVNISFNWLSGNLPATWMKFLASSPWSFGGNPELCLKGNENDYCGTAGKKHAHKTRTEILITITLGSILFLAGSCFVVFLFVSWGVLHKWASLQFFIRSAGSAENLPQDLKFEDIMGATEGFSDKYIIGSGRHGTVYRAECGTGKIWAVKKMDMQEVSFSYEMKTLNMVRHRNLVRIAGYCIRDGFGFIVYEYMQGGTLFEVLHQSKPHIALDWKVRYHIAQGLSYLHHDCVPLIIHRYIKSSNILMDSELEPKIADFGMAKLVHDSNKSYTMSSIVGTLGYIAPG